MQKQATMATMERRPTRTRTCDETVSGESRVRDATAQFSYRLETNREDRSADEQGIIVNLLREGILESLVANHCAAVRRSDRMDPSATLRDDRPRMLSVFAKEVDTTGMKECPLSQMSSFSCNSYLSEVTVLYNLPSQQEEEETNNGYQDELDIQDDALSTIQQYMQTGLYTAQINHELSNLSSESTSSKLRVTHITFLDLKGSPVNATVSAQKSNNDAFGQRDTVNPFWIFFGCAVGTLAIMLAVTLWKCHKAQTKRRRRQWKGTSNASTYEATMHTGDESYAEAYLQEDRFDDETPLEQIESATLKRAGSLTRNISEITQPKTWEGGSESIIRIIQDLGESEVDVGTTRITDECPNHTLGPNAVYLNTRKCHSAVCHSCRKASDNDPNYLCPNYYTSEDVAMRSFNDETDQSDFNIVPPSRVEKARTDDLRLYSSPARAQSRIVKIERTVAL